jgi:hypothetical protein
LSAARVGDGRRDRLPVVAAGPKSPAIGGTQGDLSLRTDRRCSATGAVRTEGVAQELPDPVTKITWSTWVELHTETAQRLGIDRGDILEVKTANGTIRAPAFPYMGIHKDAIAIPTGQGHRATASMPKFEPKSHDPSRVQWGYGRYAPRRERRRSAPGGHRRGGRARSHFNEGLRLEDGRPNHTAEHGRLGAAARARHRARGQRGRHQQAADRRD